jgi:hypothetical protein
VTSVRQPLPPYNSPPLSLPSRTSPQGALSNITDLDALLSEIGENRNGSDYEVGLFCPNALCSLTYVLFQALLLVSEFVGPSTPANGNAVPSPDPKRPLSSLLGKIELDRRRVTKDGRVKLKLSLLGTTVDRCGICLSQFKEGELATLGATCQHA